ncbi:MAG TPA: 1-(5-phosphoribosyl)-5-[(5-phosphoribosylamino)methylideneamino]imidazole-4-carboxamide isomerase [Ktedonobacteraceae bacterium]|nr:1-(5-phosphoribosyl)-5-[(5-phosphoribosylamino)methylideneamino]imidazole-4-carboxamide isomerase [Ktedonobacteraceae bacterium]
MILFPAIDIRDGQCVRLYQGDYDQMTVYSSDPVEIAQRWQEAGASWLHVVDLDGAREGHPINSALIARMCQETTLNIEASGGLRTLQDIESILALGVERVVLGTVILTNRELLGHALQRWGQRIVVGLDAREGRVAIRGWRETSDISVTELARELSTGGVERLIYTDIGRDAAMQGPNLVALQAMLEVLDGSTTKLIASGGVSSLEDLQRLAELNIEGAIIGKALYIGAVDLAQAVSVIEHGSAGSTGRDLC